MSEANETQPHQNVSDVYDELHHYTTWEGMLGILESKCLHATHYKFLNDESELEFYKDNVLKPKLQELWGNIEGKNPSKFSHPVIKNWLEARSLSNSDSGKEFLEKVATFFIASFCGKKIDEHSVEDNNFDKDGQLSMWRGYGRNAPCRIDFDTAKLRSLLSYSEEKYLYLDKRLTDVIYCKKDKIECSSDDSKIELNRCTEKILETERIWVESNVGIRPRLSKEERDNNSPSLEFILAAAKTKHYGFREEKEVRIFAGVIDKGKFNEVSVSNGKEPTTLENKKILFTKSGKPYIKVFEDKGNDFIRSINRIIVGPGAKREERAAIIRHWLKQQKQEHGDLYENIKVSFSSIPYLGVHGE